MRVSLSLLAAGAVLAAPASASAASLECGAIITASTTLRADLADCPGDGLVIGADNITLDLNGHTLDGVKAPGSAGIRLAGHRGVTIVRGTAQEFGNGVLLDAADGNVLRRVTVRSSGARGVQLQNGSDGNWLEFDTSSDNGRSGFGLLDSTRDVVTQATATGNAFSGIAVLTANRNRIVGGRFNGNGVGVSLAGSNANEITFNDASRNGELGIAVDESDDNVVSFNRLTFDGDGLRFSGDHNRIVANLVTDAFGCPDGCNGAGISGEGGTENLVENNVVTRTRVEGIELNEFQHADPETGGVPAIGNVFRANVVTAAGSDGIAVETSTDENSGYGIVKDTVIETNVVTGSAHDGIRLGRPSTLTRNVATHNGALGIEAVLGSIDGGGNLARANGDPRQCVNVFCR
jgi:parallel beta-helix repeat protein